MKRTLSESVATESTTGAVVASSKEGSLKKRKISSGGFSDAPNDGVELDVDWDFCSEFEGGDRTADKSSKPTTTTSKSTTEAHALTKADLKTPATKKSSTSSSPGFAKFGGLGFSAESAKGRPADVATDSGDAAEQSEDEQTVDDTTDAGTATAGVQEDADSFGGGGFGFGKGTVDENDAQWTFSVDATAAASGGGVTDSSFAWDFSTWSGDASAESTAVATGKKRAEESSDFKFEFESGSGTLQFGTEIVDSYKPIATLDGNEVDTGDRSDQTLLEVASVRVYRFEEGKWQEKGDGSLKLNVVRTGDKLVGRLLCRRAKVGTVICNEPILVGGLYKVVNKTRIQFVSTQQTPVQSPDSSPLKSAASGCTPESKTTTTTCESKASPMRTATKPTLVTYCLKPKETTDVLRIKEKIEEIQRMLSQDAETH